MADASTAQVELSEVGADSTSSSRKKLQFNEPLCQNRLDPASTSSQARRQYASWAPGMDRVQVRSFTMTTEGAARNYSKTFGGIDGHVRKRLPTLKQREDFANFARVCQLLPHKRDLYIVAFVNSKSGGQIGEMIMKILKENLRAEDTPSTNGEVAGRSLRGEVCDLSACSEPEETIGRLSDMLRSSPSTDIRLLVCGGDGTVTWILTALENCPELNGLLDRLPVGIVPLGTGNDLARSLGWGGRMRGVSEILEYLKWVVEAEPVTMDQWRLVLRPHSTLPHDHKLRICGSHPQLVTDEVLAAQLRRDMDEALDRGDDNLALADPKSDEVFIGFWQNYFTFGMDAQVMYHVDRVRNTTRCGQRCFQFGLGKACFGMQGLRLPAAGLVTGGISSMKAKVKETGSFDQAEDLDDVDFREIPLQSQRVFGAEGRIRNVLLVNINSYGAGRQVLPQLAAKPTPGDGLVEVMAMRNFIHSMGVMSGGCRPTYLFSSRALAFQLRSGEFMQQDGEPWRLDDGCDVLVEPHRKVTMLRTTTAVRLWHGHIRHSFWGAALPAPAPLQQPDARSAQTQEDTDGARCGLEDFVSEHRFKRRSV